MITRRTSIYSGCKMFLLHVHSSHRHITDYCPIPASYFPIFLYFAKLPVIMSVLITHFPHSERLPADAGWWELGSVQPLPDEPNLHREPAAADWGGEQLFGGSGGHLGALTCPQRPLQHPKGDTSLSHIHTSTQTPEAGAHVRILLLEEVEAITQKACEIRTALILCVCTRCSHRS